MSQLPKAFAERMIALLGEEAEAFFHTYEEPYCRGVRLNPLKHTGGYGIVDVFCVQSD